MTGKQCHEFSHIPAIELLADVVAMHAHRIRTDVQIVGDAQDGKPLSEPLRHFGLAPGQVDAVYNRITGLARQALRARDISRNVQHFGDRLDQHGHIRIPTKASAPMSITSRS